MHTLKHNIKEYFKNDKLINIKTGEKIPKKLVIDLYLQDVKIYLFDNNIKIKSDKQLQDLINKLFEQDRLISTVELEEIKKEVGGWF